MMTPQESIDEIRGLLQELKPYLESRDRVVLHRVRQRYKFLIERFFRENKKVFAPQEKEACLNDVRHFMSLLLTAEDYYNRDNQTEPWQ